MSKAGPTRRRGKAPPRKRPRRIAKKLAQRLGYMRHRIQSMREGAHRVLDWARQEGISAHEAMDVIEAWWSEEEKRLAQRRFRAAKRPHSSSG